MIEGTCPVCSESVEYEPYGDAFNCPHCGAMLEHEHDCNHDQGTDDVYCSDWLEVVR